MAQTASHPAAGAPEQDRLDYVAAVASIAWADRELDESELAKLEELCATLGLPADVVDRFSVRENSPEPAEVDRILARFRGQGLRVSLLTDVLLMTFADGRVATGEAEEIGRFARALDLETGQAILIGRYVEGVVKGQAEESMTRDLAGKLAALPGTVPHHSVLGALVARMRRRST